MMNVLILLNILPPHNKAVAVSHLFTNYEQVKQRDFSPTVFLKYLSCDNLWGPDLQVRNQRPTGHQALILCGSFHNDNDVATKAFISYFSAAAFGQLK